MKIRKSYTDSAKTTAAILKKGAIVIIPTDTIYGFSGIVPETDGQIRAIKGREETKPFIRLIAEPDQIFTYTNSTVPRTVLNLWPCALTVIVSLTEGGTAAFRCPADKWLRHVIALCEKPLYSTSVNRSGKEALHKISDIEAEFGSEVALIVDAGDSENTVPSTLIDISKGTLTVLRQGTVFVPPIVLST